MAVPSPSPRSDRPRYTAHPASRPAPGGIERKALNGALDALWVDGRAPERARETAVVASWLAAAEAGLRARFESGELTGSELVRSRARMVDAVVRALIHTAVRSTDGLLGRIAVVATGGYGRAELAPHSDLDLLFVTPKDATVFDRRAIERVLYGLWDLGFRAAAATRTVEECLCLAQQDLSTRTALLEARWLAGNPDAYRALRRRFLADVMAGKENVFVTEKLAERDARHERMGDTRYLVEPNVKEGKGGLRDLQTLFWVANDIARAPSRTRRKGKVAATKAAVAEGVLTERDARRFEKAENFLWTVRTHLHYLTGRAEERLTFDVQKTMAQRMGYTDHAGASGVERFMKHYYLVAKEVGSLTRVLCAILEEQHHKRSPFQVLAEVLKPVRPAHGLRVAGGRINAGSDTVFQHSPVEMLRLFHEAQQLRIDVHPSALRQITQNLLRIDRGLRADEQANRLFLDMLLSPNDPESTLRRMSEAGLLGRFLPDFGRVVAQMQYDMYHVYTVDEHTIRAIGILHDIETGKLVHDHPLSSRVVHEIESRRVLYMALFLHDIAKGRGGDHSEIGAEIALAMGKRFGFSDWETETTSWLVRHHLLMAMTAFKRDLEDPQTIIDFVAKVQSPERLRLLLVLTVADIRAVGPGVWNAWKAVLLRELYWRAAERMMGEVSDAPTAERVRQVQQELSARLEHWSEQDRAQHFERGYPPYWLATDIETLVRHAELVRRAEAEREPLTVESRVVTDSDFTEVLVYAPDQQGLFAKIAGAMALAGASIVDAKIQTLANGRALDTFTVQNQSAGAFASRERLQRLDHLIRQTLAGRTAPERELARRRAQQLPSRTRVFTVAPRVLIDNKLSRDCTVIEVNGRDRLGLLFDVTSALSELGLRFASAHISTWGERIVDVFYVRDIFGLKIEAPERIERVRDRLLGAVGP